MAERREPKLEEILEECLKALWRGEGIGNCLARYPQQAQELRPLLEAALRVETAFAPLEPHSYFRTRTKYRLLSQPQRQAFPLWRRRWALAFSPLLLVFLMGGTALAASKSLPDQPLYPVKLATEQVQLSLTTNPGGKAQLQVKLVEKRIEEMGMMAQRNKPQEVERVGERLQSHLRQVQRLSPELKGPARDTLKTVLKERAPQQRQMLKQMDATMSQMMGSMKPWPAPMPMMGIPDAKVGGVEREEAGKWEREYQQLMEAIERALGY